MPKYLKAIRGFFEPVLAELFGEGAEMLLLALDEACANVIKHQVKTSPGRTIDVRAVVSQDHFRFRIADFCGEDDVPNIKSRDLADIRPGGLGTHFIAEIMDAVSFEPEARAPNRMALVLEKAIPAGPDRLANQDPDSAGDPQ